MLTTYWTIDWIRQTRLEHVIQQQEHDWTIQQLMMMEMAMMMTMVKMMVLLMMMMVMVITEQTDYGMTTLRMMMMLVMWTGRTVGEVAVVWGW